MTTSTSETGGPTGDELFDVVSERMGWTPEVLDRVNDPSHPDLMDIDEMAQALEWLGGCGTKERPAVCVVPDFDIDGICAGVILYAGLNEMGLPTALHVPDYHLGHDIRPEVIEQVVSEHPGLRAVITCDAGINSAEALERARSLRVMTLVTDHHVELAPTSADMAVNPNRIDETYPNKSICGAHVAYQVVERLARDHHPEHMPAVSWLKVFAGMGTVADAMDLVGENRSLVRQALAMTRLMVPGDDGGATLMELMRVERHHRAYVNAFEGLLALLEGLGARPEQIDETFYGFSVGPTFNAIRRVDGDYDAGFRVFTCDEPQGRDEAVKKVIGYNTKRKRMVIEHLAQLSVSPQPTAPLVYTTQALPGMLGLLAQRLMRVSGMPTVVVRVEPDGSCSGSARSPEWFDVVTEVSSCGAPDVVAVGHEQACGVRAPSIARLHEVLDDLVSSRVEQMEKEGEQASTQEDGAVLVLGPVPGADASLNDIEAVTDLMARLRRLAPFGKGFPQPPVDVVVNLTRCSVRTIGSADQHVRVTTEEGMVLLWWNAADRLEDLRERSAGERLETGGPVARFRVTLSSSTFRGKTSLQGIIDKEVTI